MTKITGQRVTKKPSKLLLKAFKEERDGKLKTFSSEEDIKIWLHNLKTDARKV